MSKINRVINSPLLWSGKKTNLIEQIKPLFPKSETFIDLFGGSGAVSVNVDSKKVLFNDLYTGCLIKTLYETPYNTIIEHCQKRINEFGLSKVNKTQYYEFKDFILHNPNNQKYYLDLFCLSLFCFNGSLEFNLQKGVTSGFGKRNRFSVIQPILKEFKEGLSSKKVFVTLEQDYTTVLDYMLKVYDNNIKTNENFGVDIFFYCDVPYSITRINGYKSSFNDREFCLYLDKLTERGLKWGVSNVLQHKGTINTVFTEWSKSYNVVHLNHNYKNVNNSKKQEKTKADSLVTDEVYIYNY